MIKDVLFIFVFEIEIKRLFFMTRNVVTYRKNQFFEIIIENIMILKKLYTQKKAKARKNNNEASIVIINVDDEIFEKLINESIQWIADNDDDFLLVDDVNEKSSLNKTNESHSQANASNSSSSSDFDLLELSFVDFDTSNSSLSIYSSSRDAFSQYLFRDVEISKVNRKRMSIQYEERQFKRTRKNF